MARGPLVVGGAALVCALALAVPARADQPPDAAAVREAAESFDQGSTAYKEDRWELAATRFEAADEKVPSQRAIRMAIRARTAAGHKARAATLAAQALERYPNDAATKKLADDTIAAARAELHRLDLRCSKKCVVALGERAVPGQPRERWIVFVDPGDVTVSASFVDGNGSEQQTVTARAGGDNVLQLVPMPGVAATQPVPEVTAAPTPSPSAEAEPSETPPAEPAEPADEAVDHPGPLQSPAVFATLLGVTAVLGGVTIWSGIDTIQNPGTDVVREACRGQGSDCPELEEGKSKQLRTNVLIGVTAGLGAVTVIVAAAVTDWNGDDPGRAELRPRLVAGPDGAAGVLEGSF